MQNPEEIPDKEDKTLSGFSLSDIRDPLSEVTRKSRRSLLGLSTAGIIIHKTNLIPTKITTLGIEFSQADQAIIEFILGFVLLYFIIAFTIYAFSDLMSWRLTFALTKKKVQDHFSSIKSEANKAKKDQKNLVEIPNIFGLGKGMHYYYDEHNCEFVPMERSWGFTIPSYKEITDEKKTLIKLANSNRRWFKISPIIAWLRIMVEFILPIIIGAYASSLLIF